MIHKQTEFGHLFFWYFPTVNKTSDELVIWINGGPSSLIGQFTENGPFYVADDGSLMVNPNSWHKRANVLYVDQPIGAGFSFTKPKTGPHNEYEVGEQFYTFLKQWYAIFPESQKWKLFITGESYAGVYVPWIGKYIIEHPVLPSGQKINLKALGVGNPVLSYKYQFDIVSSFDYLKTVKFFGHDTDALGQAAELTERCRYATDKNNSALPYQCNMYEYANEWKVRTSGIKCLDRLNYKKECVPDDLIGGPGLSVYLDDPKVRQAIHVDPLQLENGGHIKWKACDERMDNLDDTKLPEPIKIIPGIIKSGVKYLVYEGDLDVSINFVGTERGIGNMTWGSGKKKSPGFEGQLKEYFVDGVAAGRFITERGMSYVRVYDAGHMVPTDQPRRGSDVLEKILGQ
ncbi:peptidase S10, serine carboxypeptidase [Obelidium mucronatum]|nr:peptidase S10, serine carboxypeptidase [Obelidium mucronatum]